MDQRRNFRRNGQQYSQWSGQFSGSQAQYSQQNYQRYEIPYAVTPQAPQMDYSGYASAPPYQILPSAYVLAPQVATAPQGPILVNIYDSGAFLGQQYHYQPNEMLQEQAQLPVEAPRQVSGSNSPLSRSEIVQTDIQPDSIEDLMLELLRKLETDQKVEVEESKEISADLEDPVKIEEPPEVLPESIVEVEAPENQEVPETLIPDKHEILEPIAEEIDEAPVESSELEAPEAEDTQENLSDISEQEESPENFEIRSESEESSISAIFSHSSFSAKFSSPASSSIGVQVNDVDWSEVIVEFGDVWMGEFQENYKSSILGLDLDGVYDLEEIAKYLDPLVAAGEATWNWREELKMVQTSGAPEIVELEEKVQEADKIIAGIPGITMAKKSSINLVENLEDIGASKLSEISSDRTEKFMEVSSKIQEMKIEEPKKKIQEIVVPNIPKNPHQKTQESGQKLSRQEFPKIAEKTPKKIPKNLGKAQPIFETKQNPENPWQSGCESPKPS